MGKNLSTDNLTSCHVPERAMDGTLLSFDLKAIIENLKQEAAWKTGKKDTITLLKTPHLAILLIAMHGGTRLNSHRSGNMISLQLIEGSLLFQTTDESLDLKTGALLAYHEEADHTIVAVEDSVFVLTIGYKVQNLPPTPAI